MEELGIRPGLESSIDVTQAIEENHDLALGIDEAQENPIAFEEMRVSKWARVRSDRPLQLPVVTRSRTL